MTCFRQLKLQLFPLFTGIQPRRRRWPSADIPPQNIRPNAGRVGCAFAALDRDASGWCRASLGRACLITTVQSNVPPSPAFGGHRADRPAPTRPTRRRYWLGPPRDGGAVGRSKSRCACAGMIRSSPKPAIRFFSADPLHKMSIGAAGSRRPSATPISPTVAVVRKLQVSPYDLFIRRAAHRDLDEHYSSRLSLHWSVLGGAGPIGGAAAQVGDQIESHFF